MPSPYRIASDGSRGVRASSQQFTSCMHTLRRRGLKNPYGALGKPRTGSSPHTPNSVVSCCTTRLHGISGPYRELKQLTKRRTAKVAECVRRMGQDLRKYSRPRRPSNAPFGQHPDADVTGCSLRVGKARLVVVLKVSTSIIPPCASGSLCMLKRKCLLFSRGIEPVHAQVQVVRVRAVLTSLRKGDPSIRLDVSAVHLPLEAKEAKVIRSLQTYAR